MQRLAIVLILLASAPAAHAGPWCINGDTAWVPYVKHLPRHPHLVFYLERLYWASEVMRTRLSSVRATIDGKPVRVAVHDTVVDTAVLRSVEVVSDRTGKLEIETEITHLPHGHGGSAETQRAMHKATYVIDDQWTAPQPATPIVSRYDQEVMTMRGAHRFSGVRIDTGLPAIEFAIRWRRDADASWQALRVPAVNDGSGHSLVFLGERQCGRDSVPLAFLERGIELELTATLPDGRSVRVAMPSPLVAPPRP